MHLIEAKKRSNTIYATKGLFWASMLSFGLIVVASEIVNLTLRELTTLFALSLLGLYGLLKVTPRSTQHSRLHWSILSFSLLGVWYILYVMFGDVDLDAILFHLNYDVDSNGIAQQAVLDFFNTASPFALIVVSWCHLSRMSQGLAVFNRVLPVSLLGANPLIWIVAQDALNRTAPVNLDAEYREVRVQQTVSAKPKNLIHIFLESTEATLADTSRFGDVAAPLKRLSSGGWTATNIAQIDLTGWTLAGQVASTCGVPLMSIGLIKGNGFNLVEEVLPEAECLGDILKQQGYTNVFLKGASLDFAGTRSFASSHGYDRRLGLNELQSRFSGSLNGWGLNDEDTLAVAYEEIKTLHAKPEPFSLTLTTIGGHAPSGFVSPSCGHEPFVIGQTNDTLKAFACTNLLVERFIDRLASEGLLADTVVVLQSDHLAMRNEVYSDLKALPRRNFFLVLGGKRGVARAQPASSIDIFPTILQELGFELPDGRAGLGQSLQSDRPTLVGRFGIDGVNLGIDAETALRDRLWGLNKAGPANGIW